MVLLYKTKNHHNCNNVLICIFKYIEKINKRSCCSLVIKVNLKSDVFQQFEILVVVSDWSRRCHS